MGLCRTRRPRSDTTKSPSTCWLRVLTSVRGSIGLRAPSPRTFDGFAALSHLGSRFLSPGARGGGKGDGAAYEPWEGPPVIIMMPTTQL